MVQERVSGQNWTQGQDDRWMDGQTDSDFNIMKGHICLKVSREIGMLWKTEVTGEGRNLMVWGPFGVVDLVWALFYHQQADLSLQTKRHKIFFPICRKCLLRIHSHSPLENVQKERLLVWSICLVLYTSVPLTRSRCALINVTWCTYGIVQALMRMYDITLSELLWNETNFILLLLCAFSSRNFQ